MGSPAEAGLLYFAACPQRLLNAQRRTNWSRELDRLLRQVHPSHHTLFGKDRLNYDWPADETEWATDVMFRSEDDPARLTPRLVGNAIATFGAEHVLKFLGRRPSVQHFTAAELTTHLAKRPEGTCIRHQLDRNSVKMYDKQGSVQRVETIVNNPRQMKSYRPSESDPDAVLREAVSRGEFALTGFRNRDLRAILFAADQTLTAKQQMTRITRLLRAHRLVQKVPKRHRYMLTPHAHETITALLTARRANLQ